MSKITQLRTTTRHSRGRIVVWTEGWDWEKGRKVLQRNVVETDVE
jgi:hypothetical protein